MTDHYDCTDRIGNLYDRDQKPEWPMYSFDRPAYMVWNAIAGRLHAAGWSDGRIKWWLQSKNPRCAMDGELGDALEAVAEAYAAMVLSPEGW